MKLFLAAAFAGALLVAAFVVSARLGPSADAIGEGADSAHGQDVERSEPAGSGVGLAAGPGSGPKAAAGPAAGIGSRVEGEVSGGGDADTSPWQLRMRVRFAGTIVPTDLEAFEFMAVTLDDSSRRSVVAAEERVDAAGERWLDARCDIDARDLELATFTLASSPYALAAGDGRVLVGDARLWRGSRRLDDAVAVDRPSRSIDLGVLELELPKLVGRLVFDPPPSVETSVLVGWGIPPDAMAAFFPGRPRGQTVTVPQGAITVACSSFGAPDSWFARMTNRAGETTFDANARAGGDITITVAQRSGLDVTVDLVRHPRAARVIFVRSNIPMAAMVDEEAFFERIRLSRSSVVLPAPERLVGRTSYPVGVVELIDGFYRAELWSLKQADGSRSLLASQAAQVAGDLVTVAL